MCSQRVSSFAASYDVVIIGGAMIGSSCAWFLKKHYGFDGSVLVIDRDLSYEWASTSHTNSCVRQQFSNELNVRISQFTAEFIKDFKTYMAPEPDVPELRIQNFGYLYLTDDPAKAQILKQLQVIQADLGAGTQILTPDEIAARYPFYNLEGIILGSLNTKDEGYFEGSTIFEWFRRSARHAGAEYIENEVTAIDRTGRKVNSVTLATGETIKAGTVINASGTRASKTAEMAGFDPLPVEPRLRYTYIIEAADPLDQDLPLTIDPTGIHYRTYGSHYMVGSPPEDDYPRAHDDFVMDHSYWENHVWPILATRIPAFERVKLINVWPGHYSYNTIDQNAIVGLHPDCDNFIFVNGFSGHGLQQSPAMGRGVAELILHGKYQSLDLSPLGVERIIENRPYLEMAVI
ncbi:MAG: FAD-binding oxidoreductase [Alphaproteobacteria bacterium]|nr:FAD-binding oxidoreductase [Alphaproteobacteria bacterium]